MNRLFILLLLGSLLGSCTLFHPYRLPMPPTSPEVKAQRKAAERARKRSARTAGKQSMQKADKDAAPGAAPAATAADVPKKPAKAGKLHFDKKNGLMKKPKLKRRIVHKQPHKPFRPFEAFKNLFHRKAKPNAKPHPAPSKADPE